MDELLREVQAEKEYILDTLRALNEAYLFSSFLEPQITRIFTR